MSSDRLIGNGREALAATSAFLVWALLSALVVAQPAIAADHSDDHMTSVSMVALLVSPEKYVAKRVNVTGYLTLFALFLTEKSAYRVDTASAFHFDLDDEEVVGLLTCGNHHARIAARLIRDADFEVYRLAELESIRVYDLMDGRSKGCWQREDPDPGATE